MERPKTPIKAYCVKFAVDTIHTESIIKAYSEADVKTLLGKQYVNCTISHVEITEIRGR